MNLKTVKETSYLLFGHLKKISELEREQLHNQLIGKAEMRSIFRKLHLLNVAIDRIERGAMPDNKKHKMFYQKGEKQSSSVLHVTKSGKRIMKRESQNIKTS